MLETNDVLLTSMYFIKFYDDRLKNYHKSNVKIKSKIMKIIIIKNYETFRDDDAKIVNHTKNWWAKLFKKYKTKLLANFKDINIKLTSYKLNDFTSSYQNISMNREHMLVWVEWTRILAMLWLDTCWRI